MTSRGSRPLAVAVTGGIGCGKSEVAGVLARMGVPVLDADVVAREVVKPGGDALAKIARRFGHAVIAADGTLDRAKLASIVFADAAAREALNEIVHPPVRAAMRGWVDEQRAAGRHCAGVIPLLYETGSAGEWNLVVCVSSPDDVNRARLRARGWSDGEIERRRAAQLELEEKKKRADLNIENDGSLETLEARVRSAWNKILEMEI